jgi:hypothetical protein
LAGYWSGGLLSHLILFGYIYPGERARIPIAVIQELISRLRSEANKAGSEQLCRGTLLSRQQYLVDVQEWGFRDARLQERVHVNQQTSHIGLRQFQKKSDRRWGCVLAWLIPEQKHFVSARLTA